MNVSIFYNGRRPRSIQQRLYFRPMWCGDRASVWVIPHENIIKITVDVVMFNEHSIFGIGMIARDYTYEVIQGRTNSH